MKYPYISYIWWYHRPSTPIGPLPKNGHRHFKFTLSHSMDKKSHHTKFYQNRLKNMEVMTMFLPPQIRGKFVRKYEILKFGGIQFSPSWRCRYSPKMFSFAIIRFLQRMPWQFGPKSSPFSWNILPHAISYMWRPIEDN